MAREAERIHKRDVVARNMIFSKGEEAKFWPLYEKYQKALEKQRESSMALLNSFISNYEDMTNTKARSLLNEALKIERDAVRFKTRYMKLFEEDLSAKTAARYYQIENKIQTIKDYERTETIPLVR